MLIFPVIAQESRVAPTPQDQVTRSDIVNTVKGNSRELGQTRMANPYPAYNSDKLSRYEANLLFEKNSSELSYGAMSALDELGQALDDELSTYDVVIEGHADRSGTYELNQWLSKARAESARRYLVQRHGIAQKRLTSIGKGYDELFDVNNPTAEVNRRVAFVFIKKH